ncbi:MAG: hypothetical protein HQK53_10385 [Oligoflexia bacterium]|nr:hypothetical protein [Oligoflexia bacterium]
MKRIKFIKMMAIFCVLCSYAVNCDFVFSAAEDCKWRIRISDNVEATHSIYPLEQVPIYRVMAISSPGADDNNPQHAGELNEDINTFTGIIASKFHEYSRPTIYGKYYYSPSEGQIGRGTLAQIKLFFKEPALHHVLYLSGHGSTRGLYYTAYKNLSGNVVEEAISLNELIIAFKEAHDKRIKKGLYIESTLVIVADFCYSGLWVNQLKELTEGTPDLIRGIGIGIQAACRGDETSKFGEGLSVFTEFLVQEDVGNRKIMQLLQKGAAHPIYYTVRSPLFAPTRSEYDDCLLFFMSDGKKGKKLRGCAGLEDLDSLNSVYRNDPIGWHPDMEGTNIRNRDFGGFMFIFVPKTYREEDNCQVM